MNRSRAHLRRCVTVAAMLIVASLGLLTDPKEALADPLANALNQPGLAFSTSGNDVWGAQTATTHDGVSAAKSGAITHNQQSVMQTTVTGPGSGSYWWKVSSETNYDFLLFYIDGVEQAGGISGAVDWQQKNYTLASGSHALTWIYMKDVSVSSGSDCGWVDQLTTPAAPPVITTQPVSRTTLIGTSASFTVVATGSPTLTYQWRMAGTSLAGATAPNLTLNSAAATNSGGYDVVVSNFIGSVTSSVATLTVELTARPPTIVTQPSNQAGFVGGSAAFSVGVNGTPPLAYQWRKDGTNLVGSINSSLAFTGLSSGNAGSYDVVVTNVAGSVTSSVATLTVTQPVTISQFGITWTFATNYQSGQYANGDWWVVGPVTITAISPASTNDGTGWIKNGSQLNPPAGATQGYDNSSPLTTYTAYDAALNAARPGGNNLSAGNPLVITSGSLVSTISKTNTTDPVSGTNRSQLQAAAILTVVTSAPPVGAFRPPPVGNDKTSYWNRSNLNYSILKSLPPPAGAPALATVESYFQKPWLEQNGLFSARYIHPADNQPAYGREMAHELGSGLLVLHLNYTPAQKEVLFTRMVQYGIDVYGAAKGGCIWFDNGGHSLGRKMPMILAGLALNDTNILAYANAATHFIFQEDRQTWYVTQYDVGRVLATDVVREPYIQADVGMPEWGEKHTSQENRDGRNWTIQYRDINYASGMGHALAAHLTTGAVAAWNWPPYFDYMDRAFGISGSGASLNVNSIQPYVADMWNAYRSSSSPPTIAVAPASPGQFAYTVCGSVGQTVLVQTSGDLWNWSPLLTNTLNQSCVTLTNVIPPSATNGFYRVLVP